MVISDHFEHINDWFFLIFEKEFHLFMTTRIDLMQNIRVFFLVGVC